MPTPKQFRTLVDQTLQTTRLLLRSYRMPGDHPASAIEQQALDHVMAVLQEAYLEVYRVLVPDPHQRGGSREASQAPETFPSSKPTGTEADASPSTRRARP